MRKIIFALLACACLGGIFWNIYKESPKENIYPQSFISYLSDEQEGQDIKISEEKSNYEMTCEEINWKEEDESGEKIIKNEYLLEATEESGGYNIQKPVEKFLSIMDDEISSRISDFSPGDGSCDLSKENASPTRDHKIESGEEFLKRQWEEYRAFDCAMLAIKKDEKLFCSGKFMERSKLIECDRKFREEKIEGIRQSISLAMEIALVQVQEIENVWPFHKKLECLNEKIQEQREILEEFADIFAKFPDAFINVSQSY